MNRREEKRKGEEWRQKEPRRGEKRNGSVRRQEERKGEEGRQEEPRRVRKCFTAEGAA